MQKIVDYIHEMGVLKNISRSGWWLIGIKDPEKLADHICRTAIIGYILAKMEGKDAGKVVMMCLFHDTHEARLNDMHKVAQNYIDMKDADSKVQTEQSSQLPENMSSEITALFHEFSSQDTPESVLAKDADLLECAFQAKAYLEQGYDAKNWIDNVGTVLVSESAKKIYDQLLISDSNDWWRDLKKIKR